MYYVSLSQDNRIQDVYDSDDGTRQLITDDEFQILNSSGRLGDFSYEGGALLDSPPPSPPLTDIQFNTTVQQQIDALERQEQLPRPLREILLATPNAELMGWYARVKAVDDAVAAYRATLR